MFDILRAFFIGKAAHILDSGWSDFFFTESDLFRKVFRSFLQNECIFTQQKVFGL